MNNTIEIVDKRRRSQFFNVAEATLLFIAISLVVVFLLLKNLGNKNNPTSGLSIEQSFKNEILTKVYLPKLYLGKTVNWSANNKLIDLKTGDVTQPFLDTKTKLVAEINGFKKEFILEIKGYKNALLGEKTKIINVIEKLNYYNFNPSFINAFTKFKQCNLTELGYEKEVEKLIYQFSKQEYLGKVTANFQNFESIKVYPEKPNYMVGELIFIKTKYISINQQKYTAYLYLPYICAENNINNEIQLEKINQKNKAEISSLIASLKENFKPRTYLAYSQCQGVLINSDKTIDDLTQITTIYDNKLYPAVWDGKELNKEHVWPNSRLGRKRVQQSDHDIRTDLHNLRLSTAKVNQFRSNYFFSEHQDLSNSFRFSLKNQQFWPSKNSSGEVARILFYMALIYPELKLIDFENLNYSRVSTVMGSLSEIKKWGVETPISEFEKRRNKIILKYQGNSNPFVEFPGLFEMLKESDYFNSYNYYLLQLKYRKATLLCVFLRKQKNQNF